MGTSLEAPNPERYQLGLLPGGPHPQGMVTTWRPCLFGLNPGHEVTVLTWPKPLFLIKFGGAA